VQPSIPSQEEDNRQDPTSVATGKAIDAGLLEPLTADPDSVHAPTLEWRAEFDFPGVLAAVPENREQVLGFVNQHCPDEGDQIDILVAVQEALANAALHGCHDDPSKKIHCVVTATATDICIAVHDPGPGFDLQRADPDKYQTTTLTHGRGICLMRSLMSDVSYARNGAEILLRKHLSRSC
jgi:anti-sigma regulatory factor (Ser/Thr protein kinase)